jgi:hypothetical protein
MCHSDKMKSIRMLGICTCSIYKCSLTQISCLNSASMLLANVVSCCLCDSGGAAADFTRRCAVAQPGLWPAIQNLRRPTSRRPAASKTTRTSHTWTMLPSRGLRPAFVSAQRSFIVQSPLKSAIRLKKVRFLRGHPRIKHTLAQRREPLIRLLSVYTTLALSVTYFFSSFQQLRHIRLVRESLPRARTRSSLARNGGPPSCDHALQSLR